MWRFPPQAFFGIVSATGGVTGREAHFRGKDRTNEIKMGITINKIAQIAGVSKRTVTRALNGQSEISPATKQRILTIAKQLRYRPNALARALALKETKTLGLIVSDNSDPFFAQLARGVEDIAHDNGYSVIFCNTDEDYENELRAVHTLMEKRVDGILLTATQVGSEDILELINEKIPFVLTNRHVAEIATDYVIVDNRRGAYEAVSHLINLGHNRIAHISGPGQISTVKERLEGYRNALTEHDIEFDGSLVGVSDLHMERGFKVTKYFLRLEKRPTAIFGYSDLLAIGALRAVKEVGLKVPDDIALVGYDDIDFAPFLEVPLTTVAQPSYEIGKRSTEILISKLQGNGDKKPQQILLKPKLIVRKSCGA